jgi:hypothetical protein
MRQSFRTIGSSFGCGGSWAYSLSLRRVEVPRPRHRNLLGGRGLDREAGCHSPAHARYIARPSSETRVISPGKFTASPLDASIRPDCKENSKAPHSGNVDVPAWCMRDIGVRTVAGTQPPAIRPMPQVDCERSAHIGCGRAKGSQVEKTARIEAAETHYMLGGIGSDPPLRR